MDQKKQDTFREKIIEAYEQKAWECLANYDYFGAKFASLEKQAIEVSQRKEAAEAKIREIQALPDFHTVENRNLVKFLKEDCRKFDDLLATFKDPNGMMLKANKEAIGWREEGMSYLERAEYMKSFKLHTPEEIAAKKAENAKVDEKPAGAAVETKENAPA